MDAKEAVEIMCEKHCKNFEMCQGTGCEPRRKLLELAERDTPKKVVYDGCVGLICPVCSSNVNYYENYCTNCGQNIEGD